MRKRLVSGMLAAVLIVGMLSGCGSSAGETAAQTTPDAVVTEEEDVKEEAAESEAAPIETVEETEAAEENILWCMDEEGIKNYDMGVGIRKGNEILENISLELSLREAGASEDYSWSNVECSYYEGDLDGYISENEGFEKNTYGECGYAFRIYESNDIGFAFVGNGILLTTYVRFNSDADANFAADVNEYLSEINMQIGDDFSRDCLVYTTEDGLYCPALNITIPYKTMPEYQWAVAMPVNGDYKYLNITSGRWPGSAQEVADNFVENSSADGVGWTALEDTVEQTIGAYRYLGRGVSGNDEWVKDKEMWMFVSDESKWSITFVCTGSEGYETYLSLMEPLS